MKKNFSVAFELTQEQIITCILHGMHAFNVDLTSIHTKTEITSIVKYHLSLCGISFIKNHGKDLPAEIQIKRLDVMSILKGLI